MQEMVAATLWKMNYTSPLDHTLRSLPLPPRSTPTKGPRDLVALAEAEAAHKAEDERLHQAMLDQERNQ